MDYLHGNGNARGADFDYEAPFDGGEEVHVDKPGLLDVTIHDYRNFFGPYASVEWQPMDRLRIDAGVRLNIARESRDDADPGAGTFAHDERTDVRAGANAGAIFTLWQHDLDALNLYVNYRDQFKPAAIDFGIGENDAGGGALVQAADAGTILKPETSRSVEGGLKGRLFHRRMEWEASGFLMNFSNLVVVVNDNGTGRLTNAGEEQFKGFETGASFFLPHDLIARANYTYHDATFTHFSQLADDGSGNIEVFDGKRIEVSPLHLSGVSLFYAPNHGFLGGVSMNYTGSRFLNRDNTIAADGFATVDLSAGYRTPRWEFRVDARNLGNRRDPVAESEQGPDQYYLMSSRRIEGGFTVHF
jgi:iron complex outermembrane receptor protein